MARFGKLSAAAALLCAVSLSACGDDDSVASVPGGGNAAGPAITTFALTQADDFLIQPTTTTPTGIPVFVRSSGSQFHVVIEGKPGTSGQALGSSTYDPSLAGFPDLQIVVSRPLGNGSTTVCDINPVPDDPQAPPAGGVPGTDPPSFEPTRRNIDTVNDLACRFRNGSYAPVGVPADEACVKMPITEEYAYVDPESTLQFCSILSSVHAFPPGDTLVTARLRDVVGNVGPQKQILVRVVATPAP